MTPSITPDFSSAQALREFVREELDQLLGSRSLVATVERLQIIRGIVSSVGPVINSGQGFNLARLGVGYVRITFSTAFVAIPTVVATCESGGARFPTDFNAAPGLVELFAVDAAAVAVEGTFHFTCLGTPVV